jgi:hypothetical protein
MTVCVISQPRFFPPLHYLHRMQVADHFVVFDTVQFNPRHEENRARLKSPQGPQWLTVPMQKISREQRIVDTLVSGDQPWQQAAVKTLEHLYGKTPFFDRHAAEVFGILQGEHRTLTALDRASWGPALQLLGVRCTFALASELPVEGKGPRLLLDICKHLGADAYLSGAFGREYLDAAEFAREGVEVRFHEYSHPQYAQRFGDFVPYLSYLDALFNAGLEPLRVP